MPLESCCQSTGFHSINPSGDRGHIDPSIESSPCANALPPTLGAISYETRAAAGPRNCLLVGTKPATLVDTGGPASDPRNRSQETTPRRVNFLDHCCPAPLADQLLLSHFLEHGRWSPVPPSTEFLGIKLNDSVGSEGAFHHPPPRFLQPIYPSHYYGNQSIHTTWTLSLGLRGTPISSTLYPRESAISHADNPLFHPAIPSGRFLLSLRTRNGQLDSSPGFHLPPPSRRCDCPFVASTGADMSSCVVISDTHCDLCQALGRSRFGHP